MQGVDQNVVEELPGNCPLSSYLAGTIANSRHNSGAIQLHPNKRHFLCESNGHVSTEFSKSSGCIRDRPGEANTLETTDVDELLLIPALFT